MNKTKIITAVLLLTLVFTSTLVSAQDSTEDIDANITKITFENNENVSREEILEVMEVELGDEFDRDALQKDMQRIMDLGYFQDIKASFNSHEGGLEVVFELVENPVIEEVNISGNEVYQKEEIMDQIGVVRGEVLNVKKLNENLKNLQHKYQDEGYLLANYKDVNISKEGVLSIDIDIGRINDIIIEGNEKTRDYVIKRNLDIEKGDILKLSKVQESYRNLYNLQYFKNITPEFERIEGEENLADLVIKVEEGKTGEFNFGAGYSSGESGGLFGYLNLKEDNLLGRGQSLSLDAQIGQKQDNYSLSFREPWLFGTENSFSISLYNRSSDKTDEEDGEYKETRNGGSISLGRPLTEMWDGNIKLKREHVKTKFADDSIEDAEDEINSITLTVDRDTSNHPFNPDEGAIDIFTLESAGGLLGGDSDFQKLSGDFRRYFNGFKEDHAWALRSKVGLGFGEIPDSELYYLGGSNTLRGYENTISGNDMVLLNAEYRFPIVDKITGVVFNDNGSAGNAIEDMTIDDVNSSIGLGARMNTPLGQLSLDYGFNENGSGKFHFSIGNAF
ncbi:MAG: BamA/OMP85 family outer membrane protein [Bacillota bacterium]